MVKHVRVTIVPKRLKRPFQSKIVPTIDVEQSQEDISYLPSSDLSVRSTQSLEKHTIKINSKRSLLSSLYCIDVFERSTKQTFPDLRKQNIQKKKTLQKRCRIFVIILVILFILAIIAVVIYLIIRFTRTTTSSTTHPPTASLRWNTIGQTVAGVGSSAGVAAHQLHYPSDLVIDSYQNLYIADLNNNRIQKWLYGARNGTTLAGNSSGIRGGNASYLYEPTGLDLDSNGNIFIADTSNSRVQYWSKDSVSGQTIAGTGVAGSSNNEVSSPYHVIYDENTKIFYVSDYDNHRIMSYTFGTLTGNTVAGGNGPGLNITQLKQPTKFFYDSVTNSLVIANFAGHNIVRWVLGATSWTLVAGSINGSFGVSSTLLFGPTGVTLDPMGNVYVTDAINARIQMFPNGQTIGTTICGITGSSGSNASQVSSPYMVKLDNQLNLYVVDTGNSRIQKYVRY